MEEIPGRGSGRESGIGLTEKSKSLLLILEGRFSSAHGRPGATPFVTEGLPEVPISRVPEAPDSSPENRHEVLGMVGSDIYLRVTERRGQGREAFRTLLCSFRRQFLLILPTTPLDPTPGRQPYLEISAPTLYPTVRQALETPPPNLE